MKIACQSAAKLPYNHWEEGSETRALARKDQAILKRPTLKEVILSKVEKQRDGCWLWTGGKRSSYGTLHLGNNEYAMVHRAAYLLWNGPMPKGKFALHICGNRLCCNPKHLYAGTKKQNRQDAIDDGTAKWNLDALMEGRKKVKGENHFATLPRKSVLAIYARRNEASKGLVKELAQQYGVCGETIRRIWRKESYVFR